MKDKAFIIACSNYTDNAIKNLNYASSDAEKIKELFQKLGIKSILCLDASREDNIPSRSRIIGELSFQNSNEFVDILYFYFSGHGFQSIVDKKDYIVVSDSVASELEDTSLSLEKICVLLKKQKAKQVVLWIDACKTILDTNSKVINKFDLNAKYLNGLTIFYSCSDGEESFENSEVQMSLFTYTLCQAFESYSCRTIKDLNDYLVKKVPENCIYYNVPVQHPYIRICPLEAAQVSLIKDKNYFINYFHEVRKKIPYGGYTPLNDIILAIDFGTSFTLAAIAENNKVYFCRNGDNKIFIPSTISFDKNWGYYIGTPPKNRELVTISNIKRFIGEKKSFEINGVDIDIQYLIGFILKSIIQNAEEYFGVDIKEVSIGRPVNISKSSELVLKKAVDFTGRHLRKTFLESDCVPICENGDIENIVLVIDFGGGTLDISCVEIGDKVYETLFATGDIRLGGIDFDDLMEKYLEKKVKYFKPEIIMDDLLSRQLKYEAERIKISLGNNVLTNLVLKNVENSLGIINDIEIVITQGDFLIGCEILIERFRNLIIKVNEKIKEDNIQLASIMLSGQMAKCFFVKDIISEYFPNIKYIESNYNSSVVQGMADYSEKFISNIDKLLLPVTTYGIKIPYFEIMENALFIHDYEKYIREDGIWEIIKENRHFDALNISSDAKQNNLFYLCIDINMTTPTKKEIGIKGETGTEVDIYAFDEYDKLELIHTISINNDVLMRIEITSKYELEIEIYDCDFHILDSVSL